MKKITYIILCLSLLFLYSFKDWNPKNSDFIEISYCIITGTGDYNLENLTTTGGKVNLKYSGKQPANNYEYYKEEALEVVANTSFSITLTQSNTWSKARIWIDWNSDGDFEDIGEYIGQLGKNKQKNNAIQNTSIEMPKNVNKGAKRMRVQIVDAWLEGGLCGKVYNQTTKDFQLIVL